MWGNEGRCNCRCHVSDSVKHMVACCCQHRIKRGYRCPRCQEKK